MKSPVVFLSCLLLTSAFSWAAAFAPAARYIVKFKPGQYNQQSFLGLKNEGVHVSSKIPKLRMIVTDKIPSKNLNDQIEYVTLNGKLHTFMLPPEAFNSGGGSENVNWDMRQIEAPEAWKITLGSKDVVVAVSDTGAFEHGQLKANFWHNPGETGLDANGRHKENNKIDDDGNGFVDDVRGWSSVLNDNITSDVHFHGTHVNGTIGADHMNGKGYVKGVVGIVSLMEVPFFDSRLQGSDENAIKSIVYASNNGAKAINASWGGEEDNPALKDAIEYAKSKGVLFVAAAGNSGYNHDGPHKNYPAAYDCENIIAVAASTQGSYLASYSDWGPKTVHIAAPGHDILSTFNPFRYSSLPYLYYRLSGTSMAAPHVTGAIALIYAANPKLNWRQVKEILLSTATSRSQLQGKVLNGGELNVGAAVKKALELRQTPQL